jgi:Rps23 Pro-64 3,4-dihydroxylase Tpa1-like proline 4-hydroxylase
MELEKIFINDDILIIETTNENENAEPINGTTTPDKETFLINEQIKEELTKEQNRKNKKNEYSRKRYEEKKDHIKELNRKAYLKKLQDNPNYRTILNDRTKKRHQKNKEKLLMDGVEVKPKGRPRKYEPKEKKANGRPRKYDIN